MAQQQMIALGWIAISRRLADLLARERRFVRRCHPSETCFSACVEFSKSRRVLLDKSAVEHLAGTALLLFEHLLHDALEKRDVAVDAHRQMQAGERRALAEERKRMLRMLETNQARFKQRIDADDLAAAARRRLQRRQHARMIGARILADDENRVGRSKSPATTVALPMPMVSPKRRAARFVAHVGAIRQIVGAELPHEELVEKRRFVAGAAGGIERSAASGEARRIQLAADQLEGIVPGDRLIVARSRRAAPSDASGGPLCPASGRIAGSTPRRTTGAKNSGVTRSCVASSATAFAPFSQNSAIERCVSGSGHAQPGQSKPLNWLSANNACPPRIGPASPSTCSNAFTTAGMPAATSFGLPV